MGTITDRLSVSNTVFNANFPIDIKARSQFQNQTRYWINILPNVAPTACLVTVWYTPVGGTSIAALDANGSAITINLTAPKPVYIDGDVSIITLVHSGLTVGGMTSYGVTVAVDTGGTGQSSRGTAVSSSNPLPITSTQFDSKNGYTNNVRATNTAVSAQFARQQIYNAGDTDIQINAMNVWAATAGTHLYSAYFVGNHDATAALANAKTSFRLGNTASAAIEVYHYASAAAIQTIGLVGSNSVTSIVVPGSSLIFGSGAITIPAGKTLEIAIGTANVAFTLNATVTVFPV